MKPDPITATILSSMNEQVYVRDKDKNLIYINPAAEKLTGWTFDEVKSKKCYEVFGDEKKSCQNICPVDRAIDDGVSILHHEGRLKIRSGNIRDMRVSITPLADINNSIGAVVVMQDITQLQDLEKTHVKTLIKLEKEVAFRKTSERELIKVNKRLQQGANLFVSGPVVVFRWKNEPGWPVEYVSSNVTSAFGYEIDAFENDNFLYDQIIYKDDLARIHGEVEFFSKDGTNSFSHTPYRILTRKNKIVWVMDYTIIIRDENKSIIHYMGYIIDITDRINAEKKLKNNEQFLNAIFNSIQDGISVLDPELNVVNTNNAMQQLYKHAIPLEGKKCFEVYHGHTEPCNPCPVSRCFQTKKLEMDHVPLRRPGLPDGTLELYAFPMVDETGIPTGVVEYTRDISQRVEDEKAKEMLLREIHHRVKNNMQVISSLLSLQAAKLSDPKAKNAFAEAESRVHSMSLVHEILYQSDTITKIDLQVYLKTLFTHITGMFAFQNIKLEIIAQNMTISMEQAVPCGLIVNELITNAMKYAFPNISSGVIKIEVGYFGKNCMELKISDNGIGLPKGFNWQNSKTLGLRLVRELVQGQLEGNWTLKKTNGVCWVIHWQIK